MHKLCEIMYIYATISHNIHVLRKICIKYARYLFEFMQNCSNLCKKYANIIQNMHFQLKSNQDSMTSTSRGGMIRNFVKK